MGIIDLYTILTFFYIVVKLKLTDNSFLYLVSISWGTFLSFRRGKYPILYDVLRTITILSLERKIVFSHNINKNKRFLFIFSRRKLCRFF